MGVVLFHKMCGALFRWISVEFIFKTLFLLALRELRRTTTHVCRDVIEHAFLFSKQRFSELLLDLITRVRMGSNPFWTYPTGPLRLSESPEWYGACVPIESGWFTGLCKHTNSNTNFMIRFELYLVDWSLFQTSHQKPNYAPWGQLFCYFLCFLPAIAAKTSWFWFYSDS